MPVLVSLQHVNCSQTLRCLSESEGLQLPIQYFYKRAHITHCQNVNHMCTFVWQQGSKQSFTDTEPKKRLCFAGELEDIREAARAENSKDIHSAEHEEEAVHLKGCKTALGAKQYAEAGRESRIVLELVLNTKRVAFGVLEAAGSKRQTISIFDSSGSLISIERSGWLKKVRGPRYIVSSLIPIPFSQFNQEITLSMPEFVCAQNPPLNVSLQVQANSQSMMSACN